MPLFRHSYAEFFDDGLYSWHSERAAEGVTRIVFKMGPWWSRNDVDASDLEYYAKDCTTLVVKRTLTAWLKRYGPKSAWGVFCGDAGHRGCNQHGILDFLWMSTTLDHEIYMPYRLFPGRKYGYFGFHVGVGFTDVPDREFLSSGLVCSDSMVIGLHHSAYSMLPPLVDQAFDASELIGQFNLPDYDETVAFIDCGIFGEGFELVTIADPQEIIELIDGNVDAD